MFLREYFPLIILLLLLVFGAKRLPDSAKSLAQSLRIFKEEMKSDNQNNKDQSANGPEEQKPKDDSEK